MPEISALHFNSRPYPAQSAVRCNSFTMLPTPTNSVEMSPRKRSLPLSADAFDLGPAAIAPSSPSSIKFSTVSNGRETLPSPTSPYGMFASNFSPVETKTQQTPAGGRTRSASTSKTPAAKKQKKAAPIIKPPPPRRNPIIQMQPSDSVSMDTTATSTGAGGKASGKKGGNGRKSATASTADERRKARKSTHSEIERRRRLKINSQFALLRSLVPACKDQDMHKLTILEVA